MISRILEIRSPLDDRHYDISTTCLSFFGLPVISQWLWRWYLVRQSYGISLLQHEVIFYDVDKVLNSIRFFQTHYAVIYKIINVN